MYQQVAPVEIYVKNKTKNLDLFIFYGLFSFTCEFIYVLTPSDSEVTDWFVDRLRNRFIYVYVWFDLFT